ncbi:MAG: hypothetical protein KIT36_09700 [Alphaproteobacteria bacterium]|nr:hypothetical protein [Alphaproteobacteria bacterium]
MHGVISDRMAQGPGCARWIAAAMVAVGMLGAASPAPARPALPAVCPGVDDLLTVGPSQEIYLDVFAYRPGILAERLRLCRNRVGDNWFDPAEEGRRQAMGRMLEWVGAFSCALTEYASAPSMLGKPFGGPRATYLREAALLESLGGSYEAYSDLRLSPPLQHFRALQLLVKLQSRWNMSTTADLAELHDREAAGDPYAAIARATLVFVTRPDPGEFDAALESLARAGQRGNIRALELGADYAAVAARQLLSAARREGYDELRRRLLAAAAYRGSPTAMAHLTRELAHSDRPDDAAALAFWQTRYRGLAIDVQLIRNACR